MMDLQRVRKLQAQLRSSGMANRALGLPYLWKRGSRRCSLFLQIFLTPFKQCLILDSSKLLDLNVDITVSLVTCALSLEKGFTQVCSKERES